MEEIDVINWSEVSRILTGKRSNIRSDYDRIKHRVKVKRLRKLNKLIKEWLKDS